MNEVTKPPRAGVAVRRTGVAPVLPQTPEWLEQPLCWLLSESTPPDGPPELSDSQRQAAAAFVNAYTKAMEPPVSREALVAWLEPLAASVASPPTPEAFFGRIEAVLAAAAALPLAVLNPESYAAAVRAFKFFPAGSELIDLLERHAQRMVNRAAAAWIIANTTFPPRYDIPPPRTPPTEAEQEAVAELLRAWRPGRGEEQGRGDAAEEETGRPPPLKALTLPRDVLRAAYARAADQGNPTAAKAAQARLAALKDDANGT